MTKRRTDEMANKGAKVRRWCEAVLNLAGKGSPAWSGGRKPGGVQSLGPLNRGV